MIPSPKTSPHTHICCRYMMPYEPSTPPDHQKNSSKLVRALGIESSLSFSKNESSESSNYKEHLMEEASRSRSIRTISKTSLLAYHFLLLINKKSASFRSSRIWRASTVCTDSSKAMWGLVKHSSHFLQRFTFSSIAKHKSSAWHRQRSSRDSTTQDFKSTFESLDLRVTYS